MHMSGKIVPLACKTVRQSTVGGMRLTISKHGQVFDVIRPFLNFLIDKGLNERWFAYRRA